MKDAERELQEYRIVQLREIVHGGIKLALGRQGLGVLRIFGSEDIRHLVVVDGPPEDRHLFHDLQQGRQ